MSLEVLFPRFVKSWVVLRNVDISNDITKIIDYYNQNDFTNDTTLLNKLINYNTKYLLNYFNKHFEYEAVKKALVYIRKILKDNEEILKDCIMIDIPFWIGNEIIMYCDKNIYLLNHNYNFDNYKQLLSIRNENSIMREMLFKTYSLETKTIYYRVKKSIDNYNNNLNEIHKLKVEREYINKIVDLYIKHINSKFMCILEDTDEYNNEVIKILNRIKKKTQKEFIIKNYSLYEKNKDICFNYAKYYIEKRYNLDTFYPKIQEYLGI